jgi:glycosyltransferase involved in cell wall biosynthesis
MRLAFVTPEFVTEPYFSGGLANYLGRITPALVRAGHEVHVFTTADRFGTTDHDGVTVHRVVPLWDRRMLLDKIDRLVPRSLYNPYQELKAAWSHLRAWRRQQSRTRFDLVQVANVSGVGLFFRRRVKPPVVVRMSSYRPEWDTLAGIVPDRGVRARWKMEEWSVRKRRFVFAPTRYVAAQVEKAYGIPKIDVIESPYFEEVVEKDAALYRSHAADKTYLLFFGRMTQMKGVHILAQALPRVLNRFPNLHAVLIGADATAPGGGSMREYVRGHVGPHANRVQLLDPLRHTQLYPFVENAAFVVLPSLVDNMPNTLLEAMGHRRVVIGTTGSCFEQLIEDGRSGFLVQPGDPEALARVIERAHTLSGFERERMGGFARARVDELHPDKVVPRLIEYYRSVIAQTATVRG